MSLRDKQFYRCYVCGTEVTYDERYSEKDARQEMYKRFGNVPEEFQVDVCSKCYLEQIGVPTRRMMQ